MIGVIAAIWGFNQASAQTLTINSGLVSYEITADYTPSGSPAESAYYSDSFDPQSQPSVEFDVNLWEGNMGVDFEFSQYSSSGFYFSSLGRSAFELTKPATFDISSTMTYSYSILFELDTAAFLDLTLSNLSNAYSVLYSPLSPTTLESFSLDYLSSGGWIEVASYTGSGHSIVPVLDLEGIAVDAGTFRISGTGLAHAGTSHLLADISVSPTPVPEPSFLVFAGVAGLLALTTRRR